MAGGGFSSRRRPAFDGLLLRAQGKDEKACTSGSEVFRSGRSDAAFGPLLVSRPDHNALRLLPWKPPVRDVVGAGPRYARALTGPGVAPPFVAVLPLLGVRGASMIDQQQPDDGQPPDRDDLLFRPVVLEDVEFGPGRQVVPKPLLDAWWNAFGFLRCFAFFDAAGNRTGRPPSQ